MEFVVPSKDIQSLVSYIGQVVPAKAFNSTQLLIKIGLDGDHLFMEASDQSHASKVSKKIGKLITTGDPVYINYSILSQSIKKFRSEDITIKLVDKKLSITGDRASFKIQTEKPSTWNIIFPKTADLDEHTELKTEDLIDLLSSTTPFTGDPAYNINISSVKIVGEGTNLFATATNLHLATVIETDTDIASSFEFCIKRECAENVIRMLRLSKSGVSTIGIQNDGTILIKSDNNVLKATDQASKMPDIRTMIGRTTASIICDIPKDELARAADTTAPFADASRVVLIADINNQTITLKGLNKPMGDAKYTIKSGLWLNPKNTMIENTTIIGINAQYLSRIAKSIKSKQLNIGISSSKQPITIKSENGKHRCILMPAILPKGIADDRGNKDRTKSD